MVDHCRQYFSYYKTDFTYIKKFAKTYTPAQAVYWYTKDCFIHRSINAVLRTGNIEECYLLRFYISGLSRQLYQLKCQQQRDILISNTPTILYRGLRQSEADLKILQSLVGHVILTKGFMSTSHYKNIALCYAGASDPQSLQSQALLLEIYVNMRDPDIIAADIAHLSNFPEELEVLFDFGCHFRIESMTYDLSDSIWHCRLVAISNKSQMVQLFPHISFNESCMNSSKYYQVEEKLERIMHRERLQKFKSKCNHEEINLLRSKLPSIPWIANNSSDRARILQQKVLLQWQLIGSIPRQQSESMRRQLSDSMQRLRFDCEQTWKLFQQDINDTFIESNDAACFLNNLGYISLLLNDTECAIELLKKAMKIRDRFQTSEHFRAQSLRNLGLAYIDQGDYDNALAVLSQALILGQQSRPTAQWGTSMTLRNFSYFYHMRRDYIKSIECLLKSLETFRECLCCDCGPVDCCVCCIPLDFCCPSGGSEKVITTQPR
ncbi:unnamed protein product [Adineta steineri]|uniref:ADP ribosyltransferase domain-containing protein n=1 Tax=Adineta steineri TaxID=433720 RepID=A0A819P378_9BILA|nr:unnamed protein product [Adineta steineri]CAF4004107.1 unnamed protein product [Adineta steineri]